MIGFDKFVHFLGNLSIVLVAGMAGYLEAGLVIAGLLSLGKEQIDYKVDGEINWGDLVADGLGIGLGFLLVVGLNV